MNASFYICITGKKRYANNWWQGPIRVSKNKPSLKENEVAVKLEIEIPNEVFEEPVFEAKFKLPKITKQIPETAVIETAVAEELTKRMGFRVKLSMEGPDDADTTKTN